MQNNFNESRYYKFAFRLGVNNFCKNKFRIGFLKTIGKILQPINSYTRYPEYFIFEQIIKKYISHKKTCIKILDVGSPKIFGLYLAYNYNVDIVLSDISTKNINEYVYLWDLIKEKAKGKLYFQLIDVRKLQEIGEKYDIIYSMSVIEHVEGWDGDVVAFNNISKSIQPGGLFLISFPFGNRYLEQVIEKDLAYNTDNIDNENNYSFFQRIYDLDFIQQRFINLYSNKINTVSVYRKKNIYISLYKFLPIYASGLIGFLNPLLSKLINYTSSVNIDQYCKYNKKHSVKDIYGDMIIYNDFGIKDA